VNFEFTSKIAERLKQSLLDGRLLRARGDVESMKKLTPQEKKELSYERDRRNVYGNAPHAARKCIPFHKAQRNRANRHSQNQQIRYHGPVPDENLADHLESLIHRRAPKQWEKHSDAPLGEVIERKTTDRAVMREQGGRRALIRVVPMPKAEE
jgi:hypothetical protein